MVAAGAGDLRKAVAPYSLPLSSISGAGGSIGLQRAWVLQYTPFVVGCAVCFLSPYRQARQWNQAAQRAANFARERQRAVILCAINISTARRMGNAGSPRESKGKFLETAGF